MGLEPTESDESDLVLPPGCGTDDHLWQPVISGLSKRNHFPERSSLLPSAAPLYDAEISRSRLQALLEVSNGAVLTHFIGKGGAALSPFRSSPCAGAAWKPCSP